jgi:hypothetical protein
MVCDDERYTQFYVPDVGQWQRCVWLPARRSRGYVDTLCSPNDPSGAYDICAETCGKCTDSCNDNSDAKFDLEWFIRDCKWLSFRLKWQDRLCYPGSTAFNLCPETCNACDGTMNNPVTADTPATASSRCGCPSCNDSVWNAVADGYTCGSRIEFVQATRGEQGACSLVGGSEFPSICGACNPDTCNTVMTPIVLLTASPVPAPVSAPLPKPVTAPVLPPVATQ